MEWGGVWSCREENQFGSWVTTGERGGRGGRYQLIGNGTSATISVGRSVLIQDKGVIPPVIAAARGLAGGHKTNIKQICNEFLLFEQFELQHVGSL